MSIIQANLYDKNEVHAIARTIYLSALHSHFWYAGNRYKNMMNNLYWKNYDYHKIFIRFQRSPLFFVAKEQNKIIWIIRWTTEKISGLYVLKDWQWKWIGYKLLHTFENAAKKQWSISITLTSSTYALPFYLKNWYIIKQKNTLIKYL